MRINSRLVNIFTFWKNIVRGSFSQSRDPALQLIFLPAVSYFSLYYPLTVHTKVLVLSRLHLPYPFLSIKYSLCSWEEIDLPRHRFLACANSSSIHSHTLRKRTFDQKLFPSSFQRYDRCLILVPWL